MYPRPDLLRSRWAVAAILATWGLALAATAPGRADEKNKSKSVGAFGESRRGDVPEGAAEMVTAETDRAIQTTRRIRREVVASSTALASQAKQHVQ